MKLHPAILFGLLAPPILIAGAPADSPMSLVAKYVGILKSYPAGAKLPPEDLTYGISVRIARESRPEVRQILMVARHFMLEATAPNSSALPEAVSNYIGEISTDSELELAGQIPPDSPALELVALHQPQYLGYIAWHSSGGGYVEQGEEEAASKAFAFFDKVFELNPSKLVKALALTQAMQLASGPRMVPVVKKYLARLQSFDPTHPELAKWKQWIDQVNEDASNAPKVGKTVPAFRLQDLDNRDETLTPASFKGKYWILDFWATWCSPCKGELPFVHKAYSKFHPAGLEILSLSWDKNAEDIATFRRDPAHPMPWHHAFPQGKVAEDLNKRFQVLGIPYVLLIGPDGKILETVENLRGENLERTLSKYLKPNS